MPAILFHHEFCRSVRSLSWWTQWGHRPNPDQTDHCQHHWTAVFRLHPRPDNHPLTGRAWQDDPFHHTCGRCDASSYPHSVSSHHSQVSCLVDSIGVALMVMSSPTIEGFSLVVGLLRGRRVLSFRLVDLSNVHGLSSTVRVLFSQFLSHICRHAISKFFILESPSRNLSSTSLGSVALIAAVFTLSATTSGNFDSCSTSVSSHCTTATWSSFTFLVRFGDIVYPHTSSSR